VNATVKVSEPPAAIVAGSVTPVTLYTAFPVLIAETVALAFPAFVIVSVCVLLAPAVMLPNESDDALAFSVADGAAVAVPLNETCCGLDAALSVNVTAPVRVPVAVGENVTEIVQLPPAARLVAQLLVWAKSPDAPMLLIERTAEPLLVRVITCVALFVPIAWLVNVTLVGDKLAAGATPVPLNAAERLGLVALL
jgi:hypothetical protein